MYEDRSFAPSVNKASEEFIRVPVSTVKRLLEYVYNPFSSAEQSEVYQELQHGLLEQEAQSTREATAQATVADMLTVWSEVDKFNKPQDRARTFVEGMSAFA